VNPVVSCVRRAASRRAAVRVLAVLLLPSAQIVAACGGASRSDRGSQNDRSSSSGIDARSRVCDLLKPLLDGDGRWTSTRGTIEERATLLRSAADSLPADEAKPFALLSDYYERMVVATEEERKALFLNVPQDVNINMFRVSSWIQSICRGGPVAFEPSSGTI